MKKKFYVTTPIYYPNDKLHIGHAYTTTLADYISRYKKMNGYEVMFLTGSDEHGQKIQDKAKEQNIEPKLFVDNIVKGFKSLWKDLNINYDLFIRTTDKLHKKHVQNLFSFLLKNDLIYKSHYSGLYCKYDESFYTKSQLKDKKCPDCGREVKQISEESYFLRISKFQDWIKKEVSNGNILTSKNQINELMNNFLDDLKDLSITRTSFNWGIKTKEDSKHIIYVWFDALQNYVSALTYPNSKFKVDEVWSKKSNVEILQLVGKEIVRFHCIYWPIVLKMSDYRKPKILAHGWLVSDDGDKMSKSKGNVVNPVDLIKNYGSDALRFYLINNIVTGDDGKFSNELLEKNINGLLVNKYSNLIARTNSMLHKYFNGVVPKNNGKLKEVKTLKNKLNNILKNYHNDMNNLKFSDSTKKIIQYMDELNNFIDITEPWKSSGEKLESTINVLINEIFNLNILLSTILINSTKEVFKWLEYNEEITFKKLNIDFKNKKLKNIKNLFNRI